MKVQSSQNMENLFDFYFNIPAFFGGSIAQNLNYHLQKPLLRF